MKGVHRFRDYVNDQCRDPTIRNAAGAIVATSPAGNPFGFTGREYHAETIGEFVTSKHTAR